MHSNYTPFPSTLLSQGSTYTKSELKKQFSITAKSIDNGVFPFKSHNSIWLFAEEQTDTGIIPYNLLSGDVLYFQGQNASLTDKTIINHERNGQEILVFYKRPTGGRSNPEFRYEGSFSYQSHSGNKPAAFILHRSAMSPAQLIAQDEVEGSNQFNPKTAQEGKDRVLASIARRRGQKAFRGALLDAYAGKCAVTGCALREVLEAAHITPYQGRRTNHVQNGLLLRSDIHTLFDLQLLSINSDDFTVVLAPHLSTTEYGFWNGKPINLPSDAAKRPSVDALQIQRSLCGF